MLYFGAIRLPYLSTLIANDVLKCHYFYLLYFVSFSATRMQIFEFKRIAIAPEIPSGDTFGKEPTPAADVFGLGGPFISLPCSVLSQD